MTCHKLLNVISLGIINWNRNYQKPVIDNVVYIYFFTTHPSVLGQDLQPNVTILISHTFLHLLRIAESQNLSPFFLLFPSFTLPPQPCAPYPPCLVLPHNFIWKPRGNQSMSAFYCSRYHRSEDGRYQVGRAAMTFSGYMNSMFLTG